MAALVSAGVSVTVTNEAFFIPAAAATVPLIFLATADEKKRPDGLSDAAGTFESNVVRTVTSLKQSTELFGIPRFLEDTSGNPHHGDARNEYGLAVLNMALGIINKAYTVRANINLNDSLVDIRAMWDDKLDQAAFVLENLVNAYLNEYNQTNGFVSADVGFKRTVSAATLNTLIATSTAFLWKMSSFKTLGTLFKADGTLSPKSVFASGYSVAATGQFIGTAGEVAAWVTGNLGGDVPNEFTAQEASSLLLAASDDFKFTKEFRNQTSLGANDSARRVAVVTALQEIVNINEEVRSEACEYNLILCPGYHELADELNTLCVDIGEEALVIADVPFDMDPDQVVTWSVTSARKSGTNLAYYYPHALASNLNGKNIFVPSSGIALRTMAYNDDVAELWYAPAGTRRGLVSGVSQVGYVTGTLGGPTTFVEAVLNQGQRDNLYKYSTNINPIVFFPGRGIIVWGQKTSAPDASAMDRVNVVRLVAHVRRQLRKNTMSFVFQPNDQLTRDSLKAAVDGFLGDLIVKRGLYDFATVCDESNNTADRIDRNELYVDIALKPVRAAEFIYIPIRIVSTGAEI